MDNISQTHECVTIGKGKISLLLFGDDLVLLTSESGLQHKLNGFVAACEIAGMKISTSKAEILHFSRNPVQCSLQVGGVPLKQMEKLKRLVFAFTSDGWQDKELDARSGKVSAMMQTLHDSYFLKRELLRKAKQVFVV